MWAEMLVDADLVVSMAAEHVREAVVLVPAVWPRVFTLKELVRRARDSGGRLAYEELGQWLVRLHAGRQHSELLGTSEVDDVADPIGMSQATYDRTAEELDDLVGQLVELAWGAHPSSGEGPALRLLDQQHP